MSLMVIIKINNMNIIVLLLLLVAVLEIVWRPRLDYTVENELLIWFDGTNERGNKTRKFIKIL